MYGIEFFYFLIINDNNVLIQDYTVYYTDDPEKDIDDWQSKSVPANETSTTLDPETDDLKENTTYTAVVKPKNDAGEGPPSEPITFETGPGMQHSKTAAQLISTQHDTYL